MMFMSYSFVQTNDGGLTVTSMVCVSSVDDCVHFHFCDVVSDDLKRHTLFLLYFQLPAMISMIDHLLRHTTVNADILSGDKPGLFRAEE